MKYWYAVMLDAEDTDWGYGSHDLREAYEMLRPYPRGYIAKIEEGDDPVCVEEIRIPVYKDKGGRMVVPGDVLMDEDGFYKVETVEDGGVDVREAEIDDDGNVDVVGTLVTLTKGEVRSREVV